MKKIPVLARCVSLVSCVFVSRRVDIEPVSPQSPVAVGSPVNAHLNDGSVIVYPDGVTVTADSLSGPGTRHDVPITHTGCRAPASGVATGCASPILNNQRPSAV